mmetsp:Transcript_111778/g.360839  ORF Transcript_111778/g.360839 Transcript_111778/m.360839 type:complete len:134 (+) Transcript_111778:79-480(+)
MAPKARRSLALVVLAALAYSAAQVSLLAFLDMPARAAPMVTPQRLAEPSSSSRTDAQPPQELQEALQRGPGSDKALASLLGVPAADVSGIYKDQIVMHRNRRGRRSVLTILKRKMKKYMVRVNSKGKKKPLFR